MARRVLERTLPAAWVGEMFETHRQRQYPWELMFSTKLRIVDGNHLPAGEKRLQPLRAHRGRGT